MWAGGLGVEGSLDYFLGCLGSLALAYERVRGILLSEAGIGCGWLIYRGES